jgi:multidrug efflux system membrane fusion protein
MSRRSAVIACLLAMGISALLSGCGGKGPEGAPKGPPVVVKGVGLETVSEKAIPDEVEAVGTVRARNSSVIAARIAGTVTSLRVREGERVSRGTLLLTIEAAESIAGAAGARAGAEEALRGVDDFRARKRLADATFGRYSALFREQAITRQEFDGKRMERDVATQGVARAEARLVQAREGARAAGAVAGYTRVTSPITGIVTSKASEVGITVFPGTPLITVEEEGNYRLEAAIPESLMGKVRPGDEVRVFIDGIGGMKGNVAEVVPAIDPASRTFMIKVDLSVKGLRSGIFGRAYLTMGSRQGMTVPKIAVKEQGALTSVWVVGKDNIARMRLVRAGRIIGDRVEILTGISPGERIIVSGVEKVIDGAKVE